MRIILMAWNLFHKLRTALYLVASLCSNAALLIFGDTEPARMTGAWKSCVRSYSFGCSDWQCVGWAVMQETFRRR